MDNVTSQPAPNIINNNARDLGASVAGAGTGTLLISLANNLADTNVYKSWLVIAAPTISIIVAWLFRKVDIYFKAKKLKALKVKFKAEINEMLTNPNLTPAQCEALKITLVEIDMANIEFMAAKIKSISQEII